MRTRSSKSLAIWEQYYESTTLDKRNYSLCTNAETIVSVRGRKPKILGWNPCQHGKAQLTGSYSGNIGTYDPNRLNERWSGPLGGLTVNPIVCPGLTVTKETWEQIMDQCNLGVQTLVSLPNFLLDCVEMKRGLKEFAQKHHAKQPKALRGSNKNVLTRAGGLWLLYSYGIKPFVSDLSAILNTQTRVLAKAKAMRSSRGVVQRFQKKVAASNTGGSYASFSPTHANTFRCSSEVNEHHTGIFMMVYRPRVDADVSSLRLASDALGLGKVGDVIWDAIPFSFAVDWFIDSQRWVRELNASNFVFPFDCLMAGTQYTSVVHTQYTLKDADGHSYPSHNLMQTAFNRSCSPPSLDSGSITTDRFGARQATYAASLLSNLLH